MLFPSKSLAEECRDSSGLSADVIDKIIEACQSNINSNRQDQSTLKQAISVITTKVNLAQAQINQTISQIKTLEKEVTVLGGVLETVNQSLDELGKIYQARVRESYRRSRISPIDMIFSTESFGDFLTKMKYLNTIKAKDQLILSELESSRLDYDQRKTEKVDKQKEVEKLKTKLENQKKILSQQQKDKQNILAITQNDEKKYQQLLSDAKTQLAAFQKFTSGASILQNTTKDDGSWGKYYNQRDALWGKNTIGRSSISVADAGCLITSMAMVMSHYGQTVTPGNIAANSDYFSSYYPFADFIKGDVTIGGIHTNRTTVGYTLGSLNDELSAGKPVIVGINRYGTRNYLGKLIPEHFLVIKSRDGDDYLMNDPFPENGMSIKFTSQYSLSTILRVDRVTVN